MAQIVITKDQLPEKITTTRTVVRKAKAEDFDEIAAWPEYPPPYEGMTMTKAHREPDGFFWWQQIERPERCHYSVVLSQTGEIIGVHAFVRIDWERRVVRNMGCRIRSDLCNQRYGTETLRPLLATVLNAGITTIRLDVIATNPRAVRCYEKCGMQIVDTIHEEDFRFYMMEMSVSPQQAMSLDEVELERFVDTNTAVITQRLTAFIETGTIEYPIHALLSMIAKRRKTTYLDILKHTLMSYRGAYSYEEYMILKDVLRTIRTMNSTHTTTIIHKFLHKLTKVATKPDALSGENARELRDLIKTCQEYVS